jgi:drug/metabolite transporter (DMT)-like permease
VLFAILLLSEKLRPLEIAGGVLIFAGIALERIRRRPPADAVAGGDHASEPDIGESVVP